VKKLGEVGIITKDLANKITKFTLSIWGEVSINGEKSVQDLIDYCIKVQDTITTRMNDLISLSKKLFTALQ
jgi:hypothetical protein